MKTKSITILLIAAGILMAFGCVFGQAVMGRGYYRLDAMADYLGLTAEQKKQIQDLQDAFLKETTETRKALDAGTLELRAMLLDRESTDEKTLAKNKSLNRMEQQLQEKAIEYGLKIKALLTTEQKALLPQGCMAGIFLGPGFGYGRGAGYGMGFGMGRGRGWGGGWGGRGPGYGRGFTRAFRGNPAFMAGRGYGRGLGLGRRW